LTSQSVCADFNKTVAAFYGCADNRTFGIEKIGFEQEGRSSLRYGQPKQFW
jgi:hypothetical protein